MISPGPRYPSRLPPIRGGKGGRVRGPFREYLGKGREGRKGTRPSLGGIQCRGTKRGK